MAWEEHRRTDSVVAARTSFIAVRPAGIAFSAGFVRQAGIDKATRVSVLVDGARRRLGFRFHGRDDADAYALTADGGRSSGGRWMQSRRMYAQYEWLAAALEGSAAARRLPPRWDPKAKIWFVEVPTPDEKVADDVTEPGEGSE